jgi:hypothetical protein
MRIRVRKPLAGVSEGISLSQLVPGIIYDVPETLGGYLVGTDMAEELTAADPGSKIPLDNSDCYGRVMAGVVIENVADHTNKSRQRSRVKKRKTRR